MKPNSSTTHSMITKYGYSNFFPMLIVGLIIEGLGFYFLSTNLSYLSYILLPLGFIVSFFTVWFFRDPIRIIPTEALGNNRCVLSPADGKILEILEEYEPDLLKENVKRLSIFLSPIDVHVNRTPVNGTVVYSKYFSGKYLVAWHPKSSQLNERTLVGVDTGFGIVAFKQITGALARRIVCILKEGDIVKAGDKIGMMKFGSRMDVLLPIDTEFLCSVGDVVVGGTTILATLPLKK